MDHKRKNYLSILIILILSFCFILCGCEKANNSISNGEDLPPAALPPIAAPATFQGFSVHYLDIGQGDCIFINFPDGKNMLIDAGNKSEINSSYIITYLNNYSVKTINYFVLSHPDLDHIGNALAIMDNFQIENMFIPYIHESLYPAFPEFQSIMNKIEEKQIAHEISSYKIRNKQENYTFAFLSPAPKEMPKSQYNDLNKTTTPTDSQINNISPIIYLECANNRFLFTGDAGKSQEEFIMNNYKIKLYDKLFKKENIILNLENIDYLKISHHGSDDGSGEDFLRLVNPKNAIISVGNDNFYGHPNSEMLERLLSNCPECILLRTDINSTIVIHEDEQGNLKTKLTIENLS